jgi:hypothetical protein
MTLRSCATWMALPFGGGAPPPLPFPDCGFAADPAEACTTQTGGCPA